MSIPFYPFLCYHATSVLHNDTKTVQSKAQIKYFAIRNSITSYFDSFLSLKNIFFCIVIALNDIVMPIPSHPSEIHTARELGGTV